MHIAGAHIQYVGNLLLQFQRAGMETVNELITHNGYHILLTLQKQNKFQSLE